MPDITASYWGIFDFIAFFGYFHTFLMTIHVWIFCISTKLLQINNPRIGIFTVHFKEHFSNNISFYFLLNNKLKIDDSIEYTIWALHSSSYFSIKSRRRRFVWYYFYYFWITSRETNAICWISKCIKFCTFSNFQFHKIIILIHFTIISKLFVWNTFLAINAKF